MSSGKPKAAELWSGDGESALDFSTMTKAQYKYKHKQTIVFDFGDQPVIADTILPELAQF
jgi:hypothetical protein